MSETTWICITAIAIVAIIALTLSFKTNNQVPEGAVTYEYDEQNRLRSIAPIATSRVILKPV